MKHSELWEKRTKIENRKFIKFELFIRNLLKIVDKKKSALKHNFLSYSLMLSNFRNFRLLGIISNCHRAATIDVFPIF